MSSPDALVLEMAREAGFDLAGLSPLAPPPDAEHFERWLEAGHCWNASRRRCGWWLC